MLKNYMLTAWRNARRDLSGFLINIIGLLVGFTVFTLAYSFAHYIDNFDTSFSNAERTYSMDLHLKPGNFFRQESVPFTFTGAVDGLKDRVPEVTLAGRVIRSQAAYEKDGIYLPFHYYAVDADIFSIFDVTLTKGNMEAFQGQLDVALLSEREAKYFFGTTDPIGKILNINNARSLTVVGVFENLPANTHLMVNGDARAAFDFIVPTTFYEKLTGATVRNNWRSINSNITSYIAVKDSLPVSQLEHSLTQHLQANINERSRETFTGMGTRIIRKMQMSTFTRDGVNLVLMAQIAGGLILGLAVLNSISLASARMLNRSREIGMRRVFGAKRRELTLQFILENTLYAVLALSLALLFAFDLFDWIKEITGLNLQFSHMLDGQLVAGLFITAILVGVISSLYPILLFSGLLKNMSLHRTLTLATSASWLRKTLVTAQFLVVTGLIFTFIVVQLQNQHLFDSVHKVNTGAFAVLDDIDTQGMSNTVAQTIRNLPGVKSVSRNSLPPFSGNISITHKTFQGLGEGMEFRTVAVDKMYFKQLGINLLAGRMLDEARELDYISLEEGGDNTLPINYVINETAMRLLGFNEPGEIIGHTFTELQEADETTASERTIVGVVPDTRLGLPTEELKPMLYSIDEGRMSALTVLYEEGSPIDLDALNKAWQAVDPAALVSVRPLVDIAEQELLPLERVRQGFMAITAATILMAAAGLFALTSYLAASKKREVSIRKIHGAPTHRILQLLMWQFTKPVSLSIALGLPIAFYLLQTQYLTLFAERIELGILPITATVILVLITAWTTTFAHILGAAKSRPAEVLRSE